MSQQILKTINSKFVSQLVIVCLYQTWVLVIEHKNNKSVWIAGLIIGLSVLLIFVKIRAKQLIKIKTRKSCLYNLLLSLWMILLVTFEVDFSVDVGISLLIKTAQLFSQLMASRISQKKQNPIYRSTQNSCKLFLQMFIASALIWVASRNYKLIAQPILLSVIIIYNLILQFLQKLFEIKYTQAIVKKSQDMENVSENYPGFFRLGQVSTKNKLTDPQFEIRSFYSSSRIVKKDQGMNMDKDKQLTYTSFYKDILKSFSDGLVIMDTDREVLFVGQALSNLMNTKNDLQAVKSLMNMKNCQEEFFRQTKMANLFTNVIKKFNSHKNLSKSVGYNGLLDLDEVKSHKINFNFDSFISESDTVSLEFEKIINRFNVEEFHQMEDTNLNFLYQVNMICSQDGQLNKLDQVGSHSPGGNIALFQITLRPFIYQAKDVTHFNQIRVLQTVNENKSQMLYQVAHEFRTPLNCTILLIQALMHRSPEPIINEYLKPILNSTKSLLSLIHDLLDLAQLKAGKFKLIFSEFSIHELFEELRTFLLPNLQLKKNCMEVNIDKNITSLFISDPNRISQILINLIGNSAKFTTQGTITIGAKQLSNDNIEIYVEDTGIGIIEEDQRKLFLAFGKLDRGREMNVQGVGLGLMISNILAERLSQSDFSQEFSPPRGSEACGLQVYSEGVGKGSRFSFLVYNQALPNSSSLIVSKMKQYSKKKYQELDASIMIEGVIQEGWFSQRRDQPNEKLNQSHSNSGSKRKLQKVSFDVPPVTLSISCETKKCHFQKARFQNIQPLQELRGVYWHKSCDCPEILIVDDEAFNVYALRMSLSKYKMKIDEANSGDEAVQKVYDYGQEYVCNKNYNCQNYQIILMDLEMHGKDGIRATKEILGQNNRQKPSIIGCSGHEASQVEQNCLDAGMVGYLSKPVNIPQLLDMIKKILSRC